MYRLKHVSYFYGATVGGSSETPRAGIQVDDLTISPSGVTAIIGPSGSGKTTLLSILAGFVPPSIAQNGEMSFGDQTIPPHRPKVAFVFQSHLLLGSGSVLLNALQGRLAIGGEIGPDDIDQLAETLKTLGLSGQDPSLTAKRSRQLSGGEAQRTAILRALVANPDVILCDEPTSSLDEHNARLTMEALREWSEEKGRPVIWVTHDIEQAAKYARHYVFVRAGAIQPLPEVDRRFLAQSNGAEKLACMRRIADTQRKADNGSDKPGPINMPEPKHRLSGFGRLSNARWIAQALSADGPWASRVPDEAILPGALFDLHTQLEPAARNRPPWLARKWAGIRSYSRYGLAGVLTVLLIQILAASFFGKVAGTYSERELQNPAVARIVFENVSTNLDGSLNGPMLYSDSIVSNDDRNLGIPELENEIKAAILERAPGADRDRVAVFGRRPLAAQQSHLKLTNSGPSAATGCDAPLLLRTVVFSGEDHILKQTALRNDLAGWPGDMETALGLDLSDQSDLSDQPFGGPMARLFLSDGIIARVLEHCDIPEGTLPQVHWSLGAQKPPVRGVVVGAIEKFPPLYPLSADLIILEADYQRAAQLADITPGSIRVANAYFPIEGFELAEAVIAGYGYEPRDDSKEAIATLQTIERISKVLPWIFRLINFLACLVIIILVFGFILDINKRALALFAAHGFRLSNILFTTFFHLFPSFVAAVLVVLLLAFPSWPLINAGLPDSWNDTLSESLNIRTAAVMFLEVFGLFLAATLCTIPFIWIKWEKLKRELKEHLQE